MQAMVLEFVKTSRFHELKAENAGTLRPFFRQPEGSGGNLRLGAGTTAVASLRGCWPPI